jgi:N-acyl homoserine lactone hydrolase
VTTVVPIALDRVTYPGGHPLASGRGLVNVFLVVHRDGPILVDTGVGRGHSLIDRAYRPERGDLAAALAGHGLATGDVRHVVNTHLHFDHAGRNLEFTASAFHVQRVELDGAGAEGYTVRDWLGLGTLHYRPVEGEATIAPGVSVLPTPGHTLGHQSVLVETDEGLVVIAGQAAGSPAEFAEVVRSGVPPRTDPPDYPEAYVRSLGTIASREPVRVYFSHHAEPWGAA